MSSWTVHLPPGDAANVSQAERFIAVKDGIRPLAVAFGPFWLLAKRLWWAALIAFAIDAALIAANWYAWLPRPVPSLLLSLFHTLLGLEAGSIQRWALGRKGWREIGAIVAHGRREAEVRAANLVDEVMTTVPRPAPVAPFNAPPAAARPVATGAQPVLGLFPEARPR